MADTELQKKTQAANRAFNLFKSALRMNGHKIRGDSDYRGMTGLTGLERRLQEEWLDSLAEAETAAGVVTQPALLPESAGRSQRRLEAEKANDANENACGLKYRHRYTQVDTHEVWAYMDKEELGDGTILYILANEHGSMKADESWIKEKLNVAVDAPEWDGKLPPEFAGLQIEVSAEGLPIKRVAPDRYAEIAEMLSAKQLAAKNPKAKEIAVIGDQSYVVVSQVDAVAATEEAPGSDAGLVLQACTPATAEEADGQFFKVGRARWKLLDDSNRILVCCAPLSVVLAEARAEIEAAAAAKSEPVQQVEPLAYLRELDSKNWFKPDGEGARVFDMAPRSFAATAEALGRDVENSAGAHFYHADLDLNIYCRSDGFELPGWEEGDSTFAETVAAEESAIRGFLVAQSKRVEECESLKEQGFRGDLAPDDARVSFNVSVTIEGESESVYLESLSTEEGDGLCDFYRASHSKFGGEIEFSVRKDSPGASMTMEAMAKAIYAAMVTADA